MTHQMKAVIMAGGFGTRLRPLTATLPKPMVPVGGVPLMEHVVRLLARHGFSEVIVLLYFQSQAIRDYFGDGKEFGVRLEYIQPTEDFGTAGSVKLAAERLPEEFLVISGDVCTDIDLAQAAAFHRTKQAQATMILTRRENPLPYGVVVTEPDGRITQFLEKPTWGQVFSDTVNTGIYILQHDVLSAIPAQLRFDFSQNLFPLLLERKSALFGYVALGYWRDIGNLEEYFQIHRDLLAEKVQLEIPLERKRTPSATLWVGSNVQIDPPAQFSGRVIIHRGARIDAQAAVANTVIGAGTVVGPEAAVKDSILWERVTVGERASLTGCVVASDAVIGPEARVGEQVIVSEGTTIGRRAKILPGVKIWPGKKVEDEAVLGTSLIWGESWARELFSGAKVAGLANRELTPEFVVKLGAAYGAFLGEGATVVTSRDASKVSRMLNRAVICGLVSAGVHAQDLRTLPIPVVRYELKNGSQKGGLHVRHSPRDPATVEIVFFDAGGQDLPPGKTKAMERLFFREDFRRAEPASVGQLDFPVRVIEHYREGFLQNIPAETIRQARFKVVVDYSWGGAAEVLPGILGHLGLDTVSLDAYVDPQKLFQAEVVEKTGWTQLATIVRSVGADLGLWLDPGGERLALVDEAGAVISGQRLLALFTFLVLQGLPVKELAVPVMATMAVEKLAKQYGASVSRVRNDHLGMMEAAGRSGVNFVGGTRGGFIFPAFQPGVDAMFAAAKFLELLARSQKKISTLVAELPAYPMLTEEVPCPWEKKGQVMRRLLEETAHVERELVDGVRIRNADGWILVWPDRRSGTFTLTAEGRDPEQVKREVAEYRRLIELWQK